MNKEREVFGRSKYRHAEEVRRTSLSHLIAENLMHGHGVVGGTVKSISDKFIKSKILKIKEKFDILNLASFMLGRSLLGTAIVGRMMGRSGADIAYFAGKEKRRKRSNRDPMYTRLSAGRIQPLRKNEGVADVFGQIYNFMRKSHDDKVKQEELARDFEKIKDDNEEMRYEKLLDAIKQSKEIKPVEGEPVEEKKPEGILGFLKKFLKTVLEGFLDFGEHLFNWVGDFFKIMVRKIIGKIGGEVIGKIFSKILKWMVVDPLIWASKKIGGLFYDIGEKALTTLIWPAVRKILLTLVKYAPFLGKIGFGVGLASMTRNFDPEQAKWDEYKPSEFNKVKTVREELDEDWWNYGGKVSGELAQKWQYRVKGGTLFTPDEASELIERYGVKIPGEQVIPETKPVGTTDIEHFGKGPKREPIHIMPPEPEPVVPPPLPPPEAVPVEEIPTTESVLKPWKENAELKIKELFGHGR